MITRSTRAAWASNPCRAAPVAGARMRRARARRRGRYPYFRMALPGSPCPSSRPTPASARISRASADNTSPVSIPLRSTSRRGCAAPRQSPVSTASTSAKRSNRCSNGHRAGDVPADVAVEFTSRGSWLRPAGALDLYPRSGRRRPAGAPARTAWRSSAGAGLRSVAHLNDVRRPGQRRYRLDRRPPGRCGREDEQQIVLAGGSGIDAQGLAPMNWSAEDMRNSSRRRSARCSRRPAPASRSCSTVKTARSSSGPGGSGADHRSFDGEEWIVPAARDRPGRVPGQARAELIGGDDQYASG